MNNRNGAVVLVIAVLLLAIVRVSHGAVAISTGDGSWEWKNPRVQGNHLNDVQMIDDYTGWAVGYSGTILKTTNQGQSWSPQQSHTNLNLSDVCFIDSENGWIVGGEGAQGPVILKTTDGGAAWRRLNPGISAPLYSVHFVSEQVGWAGGAYGYIIKTEDGGDTWSIQRPRIAYTDVNELCFVDEDCGWAAVYYSTQSNQKGLVYRTTDGGETWTETEMGAQGVSCVHFVDRNNGWAVAGFQTQKTTDGGLTWSPSYPSPGSELQSVFFVDANHGWVTILGGSVVYTNNGGSSWTKQNWTSQSTLKSICVTSNYKGIAVGFGGKIAAASDARLGWTRVGAGNDTDTLRSVDAVSRSTCWAGGSGYYAYRTSDKGVSWVQSSIGCQTGVRSIDFVSASTGWAVGQYGKICYTGNSGYSWYSQTSGTTSEIGKTVFLDYSIGWALAGNQVLRTTNGGASWTSHLVSIASGLRLFDVHFFDSQIGVGVGGYAVGGPNYQEYAFVARTTDGGVTWTPCLTTGKALRSVCFVDSSNGWAVGVSGRVIRTTDGGISWTDLPSGIGQNLYTVIFADTLNGWILGSKGHVYLTFDGGVTWTLSNSGVIYECNDMAFFDNSIGWLAGEYSAILSTNTAGQPGCIWAKRQPDGQPADFGHLVVTCKFPGFIYAEHPERNAGIKINTNAGVNIGDFIYVHGAVGSSGSEKVIDAYSVEVVTECWGDVSPWGMNNQALGSNNLGLLVKTWGKVSSINGNEFTVDDGSGGVKCIAVDGIAISPHWKYVAVRGVNSLVQDPLGEHRVLRISRAEDIEVIQ